ncbi:MAG: methyltransferase domain-containing protein [Acidobacteria bacterium]|nr:methyltransferase domain-containing protein [Acidobacteriota bacterium]
MIVDIGTGDGRFVSRSARANPRKFYIGIDANAKPLEKVSMKATRKPAKGGLPNALFVQAAIEDLPPELDESADEIHIHFPWGSLLKTIVTGDARALAALRRIAAPECLLEIVVGLDETRDRTEIERLGLPRLSEDYLRGELLPKFAAAGFEAAGCGFLPPAEWSRLETSWARKLQTGGDREVVYLVFEAV